MSVPAGSANKYAGMFQYLLTINGSEAEVRQAQAALSTLTPETAAVYQALNILPEGDLKSWLMANPVQFWKKVIALFTGKKWTTGDYILGERMSDQIYCNSNIGRSQVSDEMVVQAHNLFNQLFGVRISTTEDLDALDFGVSAYKARAASQGIGTEAIERAVYLKQNYFPISTYNTVCWDLRYFELYPLVDRIPDYELGKWYSGPVLGGAIAVDGLIPLDASSVLKQYPGGTFDTETGQTTTAEGEVLTPGESTGTLLSKAVTYIKENPGISIAVAAALGYVIIEND